MNSGLININKKVEISNQNILENNNKNNNIENTKKYFPKREHYGNIGSNLILCNKYVFGFKNGLCAVISLILAKLVSVALFIIFNHPFFPIYIYYRWIFPFNYRIFLCNGLYNRTWNNS